MRKIPEKWLREDACLRFNCGGYSLTLRAKKAVRVASISYGCSQLGTVTGELADRAKAHAQATEGLKRERAEGERALLALLSSVSTLAQLEKTWPEGKPFYQRFMQARPGSNLPAVQVSEINKMLGLKDAA